MGSNNEDISNLCSGEFYSADEIRTGRDAVSIGKDWLGPTGHYLQTLEDVKPSVYNFSLTEAKNLKATNVQRKPTGHGAADRKADLPSERPLQAHRAAWGSSCSIPDLLHQHGRRRPESAQAKRVTRPSSGKRPRPQSAKPSITTTQKASFSILGTRYAHGTKPPKCPGQRVSSVGWEAMGNSQGQHSQGTPLYAPPNSRLGWVEQSARNDIFVDGWSDEEIELPPHIPEAIHLSLPSTEDDVEQPDSELSPHVPESIHFSLPSTEEVDEDEYISTERLLERAAHRTGQKKDQQKYTVQKSEFTPLYNNLSVGTDEEDQSSDYGYEFDPENVVGNSSFRDSTTAAENTDDAVNYSEKLKLRVHFKDEDEALPSQDKEMAVERDNGNENSDKRKAKRAGEISRQCQKVEMRIDNKYEQLSKNINILTDLKKSVEMKHHRPMSVGKSHKSDNVTEINNNNTNSSKTSRPRTPISVVTINYFPVPDLRRSKDKTKTKTASEVETMMSHLQMHDGNKSLDQSFENNQSDLEFARTVLTSAPTKNYYEMRNDAGSRSGTNDNSEKEKSIMLTTTTYKLGEDKPTGVKVQKAIESAPGKEKTYTPNVQEQRKPTKPMNVPNLNLDPLNDTYSRDVSMATKPCLADKKRTFANKPQNSQPVLLRRPRTNSAPIGKQLRGKFPLRSDVCETRKLSSPSPSILSDLDLGEEAEVKVEQTSPTDDDKFSVSQANEPRPCTTPAKVIVIKPVELTKQETPEQQTQKSSKIETVCGLKSELDAVETTKAADQKERNTFPKKPSVNSIFRQSNFKSLLSGHYSSYSRNSSTPVRKTATSPVKKAVTKPAVNIVPAFNIVTKDFHPDKVDVETEEIRECRELQQRLRQSGVNVNIHTLKRALLPPDGSTYYFETTAELPKSNSHSLLSHPRVWLPEEHAKLRQAKRRLARANEQLWLQKRAEEREAKREAEVAAGKSSGTKKTKRTKSGKKGKRSLKRSQSVT